MGKSVQKLILCIVIIDQNDGFRRNFMIQWKKNKKKNWNLELSYTGHEQLFS